MTVPVSIELETDGQPMRVFTPNSPPEASEIFWPGVKTLTDKPRAPLLACDDVHDTFVLACERKRGIVGKEGELLKPAPGR